MRSSLLRRVLMCGIHGRPLPDEFQDTLRTQMTVKGYTSPVWLSKHSAEAHPSLQGIAPDATPTKIITSEGTREFYNLEQTVSLTGCTREMQDIVEAKHYPREVQKTLQLAALQFGYTSHYWIRVETVMSHGLLLVSSEDCPVDAGNGLHLFNMQQLKEPQKAWRLRGARKASGKGPRRDPRGPRSAQTGKPFPPDAQFSMRRMAMQRSFKSPLWCTVKEAEAYRAYLRIDERGVAVGDKDYFNVQQFEDPFGMLKEMTCQYN